MRLMEEDPGLKPVEALDYPLYGLNGRFENNAWLIELKNLLNDSVELSWKLEQTQFNNDAACVFSHADPRGPLLLSDSSLVLLCDETYNLFRLDKNSIIRWENHAHIYHHSMNQSAAGNLWVCSMEMIQDKASGIEFYDNFMTLIDVETGKKLFHKSLYELFEENKMSYWTHGFNNEVSRRDKDPYHLNDIEPVLEDGPFWKKDDLFISLRHRSMILHYRPSTNELIRILQGPFLNQHDVDIIDDSTLSIFNNNVSSLYANSTEEASEIINDPGLNKNASVLLYHMECDSFSTLYPEQFMTQNIFTTTQGLHHLLKNGDLWVESSNKGLVYLFNEKNCKLKKYYNRPSEGLVEYAHWVRLYEDLDFLKQ